MPPLSPRTISNLLSFKHKMKVLITSTSGFDVRLVSTTAKRDARQSYKIVIVGAGTGGCAMASKFAKKAGKGQLAIIDPSDYHYNQSLWTFVGAGLKPFRESRSKLQKVINKRAVWIHDSVADFHPKKNLLHTARGLEITYGCLVVAMGLQLNFDKIKGFPAGLQAPGICSTYSPQLVEKTYECIKNFKGGNAIFTFPNTPIKCPGAPLKIAFLAENIFNKAGLKSGTKVIYNTAQDTIYSAKKYATELTKLVTNRDIRVNFQHNLVEVNPHQAEAIFEVRGLSPAMPGLKHAPKKRESFRYDMLHVVPPMSTPEALRKSPIVDKDGFLDLNKLTLQHAQYPNIFGLGDCTNLPTARSAAGVAAQFGVVRRNLELFMKNKPLEARYDGYTACPIITRRGACVLAEFDYKLQPLETFGCDQSKERWDMYLLAKYILPNIYWNYLVKGRWEGPEQWRKRFNFDFTKKEFKHIDPNNHDD